MTAFFVQDGNSIDYTPVAAVAAGDVVVQGDLVGVAKTPIAAGVLGALAVNGVFDFPKATGVGTAIAAGASVYWDEAGQQARTDSESGANKLLGKTTAAAGDDGATVRVRLSQ
jgi:predicted RecA/RadA family phage recombinase